ncbi:MAG TPA: hypothetical protein DEQ74_01585 [Wolbachia sp.]|nr:hypothetical protein [Wolbachia sp.]
MLLNLTKLVSKVNKGFSVSANFSFKMQKACIVKFNNLLCYESIMIGFGVTTRGFYVKDKVSNKLF